MKYEVQVYNQGRGRVPMLPASGDALEDCHCNYIISFTVPTIQKRLKAKYPPNVKIKLVPGVDWMICAPCPSREPRLNACIHVEWHGRLANQLRDLRMLQKIGLKYGASMKAKDLYKLILKIKTTNEICALEGVFPSVWEDGCGVNNLNWTKEGKENEVYKKGREMLIDALGIKYDGGV